MRSSNFSLGWNHSFDILAWWNQGHLSIYRLSLSHDWEELSRIDLRITRGDRYISCQWVNDDNGYPSLYMYFRTMYIALKFNTYVGSNIVCLCVDVLSLFKGHSKRSLKKRYSSFKA